MWVLGVSWLMTLVTAWIRRWRQHVCNLGGFSRLQWLSDIGDDIYRVIRYKVFQCNPSKIAKVDVLKQL